MNTAIKALLYSLALGTLVPAAQAQFVGQGPRDNFVDTSVLKPAPGSKVSIVVFEDLGCPACARAHPIELEVAARHHVPIIRRDFPLAQHIWTFDGAVFARYLEDKVNPKLAADYRTDVFRAQMQIATKEDLQRYNAHWMQSHGKPLPATIDPDGKLAAEVHADYDLGTRLHVTLTPTIIVVTEAHYQVVCGTATGTNDPSQLAPIVEGALAQVKAASPITRASAKPPGVRDPKPSSH